MALPGPMNPDAVIAQTKRLLNAQLKAVCKASGLQVSGAKAALQQRIISRKAGPPSPNAESTTTRERGIAEC